MNFTLKTAVSISPHSVCEIVLFIRLGVLMHCDFDLHHVPTYPSEPLILVKLTMKKSLRDVVKNSARCSGCSRMYSWSVSEAQPINLLPLLCGDIFCRACLANEVHKVLSSRQVPLRCCERVVPHDFIREVIAKEEDVYYSYLLDRAHNNTEVGREAHVLQIAPGNEAVGELETKQPATHHLTAQVPNALDESASKSTAASFFPKQTRYPSRQRHSLLAQKASMLPGNAATNLDQRRGASDARLSCHMCNIQEGLVAQVVLIKAPCAHMFCYRCLEEKVRSYLDMNSSGEEVPASCCGQLLPLDLVQLVIFGRELTTYAKEKVKYEIAREGKGGKRKAPTESKSKAPAKKMKEVVDLTEEDERMCVSCVSQVTSPDQWRVVPCGHGYCVSCLTTMVKLSLTNRNQIPVRCCSKEFPTEYIKAVLDRTEFDKYSRYLAERDPSSSTLRSDRDYAAVVRKNRGKQCPTCGVGVVKLSGCNAITCPLGHFFCWKCQQKRCTCGAMYRYH